MSYPEPLVITLWEDHGSILGAVAARVGELLGMTVHPGLPAEVIEEHRQKGTLKKLAAARTREIEEQAARGGVIPGGNAAFVLQDRPATLHVKLDGIARRRERTQSTDLTWDYRQIDNYDVIFNSSSREVEEIAQFIAAMAQARSEF